MTLRNVCRHGGGDPANEQTFSMGVFNGQLYAGTRNMLRGARLFRLDETTGVETVLELGPENKDIYGLIEFDGHLYFGTYNIAGGELFRMDKDGRAERVFGQGLDTPQNQDIWSIRAWNSRLYFGVWNSTTGGRIYCSRDGLNFALLHDTADPAASYVRSLTPYQGRLFASLGNRRTRPHLLAIDQDNKVERIQTPIPDPRGDLYIMLPFGDRLVFSVSAYHQNEATGGCEIWAYDGESFRILAHQGFGRGQNRYVLSLCEFKGELYAATYNFDSGCELWKTRDGEDWTCLAEAGFDDLKNESVIYSMAEHQGKLWIGTRNPEHGFAVYVLEEE